MLAKPVKRIKIVCSSCGNAHWDEDAQEWVLGGVMDSGFCNDCEEPDVKLTEVDTVQELT